MNQLEVLVNNKIDLQTLTLVCPPRNPSKGIHAGGHSTDGTFDNFFSVFSKPECFSVFKNRVITVIPLIRHRLLNIHLPMVKMVTINNRIFRELETVEVRIDTWALPVNHDGPDLFAKDEAMQRSRNAMQLMVRDELLGLQARMIPIYEDHYEAIRRGFAILRDNGLEEKYGIQVFKEYYRRRRRSAFTTISQEASAVTPSWEMFDPVKLAIERPLLWDHY